MMLSGIVLVIACLNLANMLLAARAPRGARNWRSASRLGADAITVVRQLLTESALLAGSAVRRSAWCSAIGRRACSPLHSTRACHSHVNLRPRPLTSRCSR